MENKTRIVILAAGKGTRMKSELPKALAPLLGKPILSHLLESIEKTQIDPKPIIVVGHQKDLVIKELGNKYEYVAQEEQLGTAHALKCAYTALLGANHFFVLYADQPFIKSETLIKLHKRHLETGAKITFATTTISNFENENKPLWFFARIVRENEKIKCIREFKDMTEEEKNIKEVNAGCYIFDAAWVWENLPKIKNENAQKEYYITDLLPLAYNQGDRIESISIDKAEALGANSKEELEILEGLGVK